MSLIYFLKKTKDIFLCDSSLASLALAAVGGLWGLQYYWGTEKWNFNISSPFEFILAAIFFAITVPSFYNIRGLSGWKNFLASIFFWILIFPCLSALTGSSFLLGRTYVPFFRAFNIPDNISGKFLNLDKALFFDLWPQFFLLGIALGAVYSNNKKIHLSALIKNGFFLSGFAALAPLIGNAVGLITDSVLLSFVVAFVIFGCALNKLLAKIQ